MRAVVQYFLDKSIFLNLLTGLLLLVGAYKSVTLNREAFPNINFDIVSVATIYPGASASEVEKLVTKPIEDNIKAVDGIKEFRSASIENRSGIVITIDPNTKNSQKVVDDIKSAVEKVEALPEDAKKPLVTEITSARTPVIEVNVGIKVIDGKPSLSESEFQEKVKILEELLTDIPEVGRISKRGYRDKEMHVDLNPDFLGLYDISTQQVVQSLRLKNISFPGGNISDGGREAAIRTMGEFDTPSEISEVFVRANEVGRSIKLKDVAKVEEDFVDREYIEKTNIWKGANQCGPMDDWLLGKDVKNIEERIDQVKWLELDCEKRTVKNMIKYNLPVNISSYIQKANSYILFYNYIKETRLWCKMGNSPDEKSNKSLWSLCPDKFMPRSYYKTIPKNIYNKFIELDI